MDLKELEHFNRYIRIASPRKIIYLQINAYSLSTACMYAVRRILYPTPAQSPDGHFDPTKVYN